MNHMLPSTTGYSVTSENPYLPNRNCHPFRALAMTLSLLTLSACAGTVPVSPTAVSTESVTPAAQPEAPAAPAAPPGAAAPATTPAQAAAYTIDGVAMLSGAPLADGQVQVFDAMTGALLGVGGDGLSLAGAVPNTDVQGKFSVALNGMSNDHVVKVVVSKGDSRIEALSTSDVSASAPAARRVLSAGTLTVDEVSTVETGLASGLLQAAGALTPASATPILVEVLVQLKTRREQLRQTFHVAPRIYQSLVQVRKSIDAEEHYDDTLQVLVGNSGLQQTLSLDVVNGLAKLSEAAAKPENRQKTDKPVNVKFKGLPLSAAFDAEGKLEVTNTRTGAKADKLDEAAIVNVTRKPSGKRKRSSSPSIPSKWAMRPSNEVVIGDYDDPTHMTVTSADLTFLTSGAYQFVQSQDYITGQGSPFSISLKDDVGSFTSTDTDLAGGATITYVLGAFGTQRQFTFAPDGRLVGMGSLALDPEEGALTPAPDGIAVSRSYHFSDSDGYVWNLYFDTLGLAAFVLTDEESQTTPVMTFTRIEASTSNEN
jgi:hypothetical protein